MDKPNYDVLDRIMRKYYPQKWKKLKEQYYGDKEGERHDEEEKTDKDQGGTGRKSKSRRVHKKQF